MRKIIAAICLSFIILQISAAAEINIAYTNEIIRQVNSERTRYGLNVLTVDSELSQAAYIRATEIARRFSHTRPDGSSWSTVARNAKGENIAMGYGYPDKVMAAWLTSSGHRRNILKSSYGSIGVCAYNHNGIIYWVQLFGS